MTDGVLDCLRRSPAPGGGDGERRRLLFTAADSNCKNLIEAEQARRARERAWFEEIYGTAGTCEPADRTPSVAYPPEIDEVARLMPDDVMRDTFRIWLKGGRRTDAFAHSCDAAHLSPERQRELVKRQKDRLRKFLRRNRRVKEVSRRLRAKLRDGFGG